MVTRSMSKLAAAAGGLALSVLAGAGIASADAGLSVQAINTTCNYRQVVAALKAQYAGCCSKVHSHPRMAQSFLQNFLASPPLHRACAGSAGPGAVTQPRRRAVLSR